MAGMRANNGGRTPRDKEVTPILAFKGMWERYCNYCYKRVKTPLFLTNSTLGADAEIASCGYVNTSQGRVMTAPVALDLVSRKSHRMLTSRLRKEHSGLNVRPMLLHGARRQWKRRVCFMRQGQNVGPQCVVKLFRRFMLVSAVWPRVEITIKSAIAR